MKQLLTNSPLTIVGDGNQSRDFVYVTDLADAFYKATITKYEKKIWNVGSSNPKKINYLARLLKAKEIIYLPNRPGEPKSTHADITLIKNDLKWRPKISFEQGVKKVLKDINYWNDAPLWTEKKIHKVTKKWFKNLG